MKGIPLRLLVKSSVTSFTFNYNAKLITRAYNPLLSQCSYFSRNQTLGFSTKTDSGVTPEKLKELIEKEESDAVKTAAEQVPEKFREVSPSVIPFETPETAARRDFYRVKNMIPKLDESEFDSSLVGYNARRKPFTVHPDYVQDKKTGEWKMLSNRTDTIAFIQQDIDLRPEAIRRWWARNTEEYEIKTQKYNPKRHNVLGNDLAAAHFFVFRKGKVKFLGQPDWVTEYRLEPREEDEEEEVPKIVSDLVHLPQSYDPNFLVEAVDCSDMTDLRYEGLENLKGLSYCRSLKFENCVHLDAWCMDRLAVMFADRLIYLDISGCHGLTEGALCALSRFRQLRILVVRNLPQIRNKDLVCAWLEEMNPELEIVGTNYEAKLEELQLENERLDKKALELEAATIDSPPPVDSHSQK